MTTDQTPEREREVVAVFVVVGFKSGWVIKIGLIELKPFLVIRAEPLALFTG